MIEIEIETNIVERAIKDSKKAEFSQKELIANAEKRLQRLNEKFKKITNNKKSKTEISKPPKTQKIVVPIDDICLDFGELGDIFITVPQPTKLKEISKRKREDDELVELQEEKELKTPRLSDEIETPIVILQTTENQTYKDTNHYFKDKIPKEKYGDLFSSI